MGCLIFRLLSASSDVWLAWFHAGCVQRSTSASVPVVDRYDLANAVYENDCDECRHSGVRERVKCGGRQVCCLRLPAY